MVIVAVAWQSALSGVATDLESVEFNTLNLTTTPSKIPSFLHCSHAVSVSSLISLFVGRSPNFVWPTKLVRRETLREQRSELNEQLNDSWTAGHTNLEMSLKQEM